MPTPIWGLPLFDRSSTLSPIAAPFNSISNALEAGLNLFKTQVEKITRVSVASAAARDARFPSPVQGDTVWRTDRGAEEVYFAAFNASTNSGGAETAGWYIDGRRPIPLSAVLALASGYVYDTAESQASSATLKGNELEVRLRVRRSSGVLQHVTPVATFTTAYRIQAPMNTIASGLQSGGAAQSAFCGVVLYRSAAPTNPGGVAPVGPNGSATTLEVTLNFSLI